VEALVLGDDDWVELGTVRVKAELEVPIVTDEDGWVDVWDELWDELWLLEDKPPWLPVPTPPAETHGGAVAVVEPNGIVRTVEHVVVWDELWESDEPAVLLVANKKYPPAAAAAIRRIATAATAIAAIPPLPSTDNLT
jgi:hypothetical protein